MLCVSIYHESCLRNFMRILYLSNYVLHNWDTPFRLVLKTRNERKRKERRKKAEGWDIKSE